MPILHMLWLMFLFFLMLAWIWVIIGVISDIFRSKDLGGWGKGFWSLFIGHRALVKTMHFSARL